MATIPKLKRDLLAGIADARALYAAGLAAAGLEKSPIIESAFLLMFKSWEAFLEDVTVCFLCGRPRCGGGQVHCHIRVSHEETARGILYQENRYLEWTDPDAIRDRLERFFPTPSVLVSSVTGIKSELGKMRTVRNAVAHSSRKAHQQLSLLARNEVGGNPSIARPADFLTMSDPQNPRDTIFDRFADALEAAGVSITG